MNDDYRDPYTFEGDGSVIFETGQWYPGEYPPGVIKVPGEYDRRCAYFKYDLDGNLRVASRIPGECGGTGGTIEEFIASEPDAIHPSFYKDLVAFGSREYSRWRAKLNGGDQMEFEQPTALYDPDKFSFGDPAEWGAYEIPDPPMSYVGDDGLGGLGSGAAIAIGAVVVLIGLGLALKK